MLKGESSSSKATKDGAEEATALPGEWRLGKLGYQFHAKGLGRFMPSGWIAIIWSLLLLGAAGCASERDRPSGEGFAIEHVTVLPMTRDGAPIENATLIVRGGRIAAIGRAGAVRVPRGLARIEGRGRWLMPGLADMHVHTLNRGYGREAPGGTAFPADYMRTTDVMLPFIANGVTQILEMSALPETLVQRDEIESGAALGPHVAAAAMLDGDPAVWPLNARVARVPEEGRQAVRAITAAGFPFVKVYTRLEIPVFEAVLEEARLAGVRVIGHVPAGSCGRPDAVLVPGFAMVAHAEELSKLADEPTDADLARYAALSRENGMWLTSTLTTNVWIARQTRDPDAVAATTGIRYVHPALVERWLHANRYTVDVSEAVARRREALVDFDRRVIRAFVGHGVPVMAGTDSIIPGVVYGFSLHDELELMAAAGLTNRQVLESATRLPAEFLDVDQDRGTIETGKAADFILLGADPLADVANTRAIAAVVIGGRYLPRTELDAMMRDLGERYARLAGPAPRADGAGPE